MTSRDRGTAVLIGTVKKFYTTGPITLNVAFRQNETEMVRLKYEIIMIQTLLTIVI